MKEVLDFISHFKGAEDTFLHGCCYWFAWILKERFDGHDYYVTIFHDPIEGHFIARFVINPALRWMHPETYYEPLDVHFFDIRGDVTEMYNEEDLENMWVMEQFEERRWGRLMCDCREFISPDDDRYPSWLKSQVD